MTDQPQFSFSRETVDENRLFNHNRFSSDLGERLTSSFTDMRPFKDENTAPRKSLRIEENSLVKKLPPSSRQSRRGRFEENTEGIYRNRHLRGMGGSFKEANSMIMETQYSKYRNQSPPIRDSSLPRNVEMSTEDKENYDSNKVTRETRDSGDLSQVYNIFKYTLKKEGERSRTPSVGGLNLPKQTEPAKERSTEYNTRPTDVSFNDPRQDAKRMSSSFEDMKLFYLRRKRAEQKILHFQ